VWTGEYRFRHADGRYRDVFGRASLLRDEQGRCLRVIGSILDVTAQREMKARLEVSERVVAVGTLAAGVGHELAGPLSCVIGNVLLAMESLERGPVDKDELKAPLVDARLGVERARGVLEELNALARGRVGTTECVDVSLVARDSLRMLDASLRRRALVEIAATDGAVVDANRHRIGQVLTNLLTNALQALDESASNGRVSVVIDVVGDRVRIAVEDNGHGLSEGDEARVFLPFFTTRKGRGGTGLGLAVAQALVTAHQGTIDVERLAPGTRFVVTFPRAKAPLQKRVDAPSKKELRAITRTRARILVVDDDELTLRLVRHVLAQHHDVTAVLTAEEALLAVREQDFDIVLSDVVMPGLGGGGLRDAIAGLGRTVRFAFLTGGSPTIDLAELAPILKKPFTPDGLRQFVDEL
jgi:signal transduction histidine kinase